MLTTEQLASTGPVVTGGWAELLSSEDRHAAQGFRAGVLVLNLAGELLRHIDDETRGLRESEVVSIVDRHLGWTDRSHPIAHGRLGVVVVPIDGALALARRARELHHGLRGRGLDVDVAYSIRRRTGGLIAAAARADAALDTALARRSRR